MSQRPSGRRGRAVAAAGSALTLRALEELGGAVLVLDDALTIVASTPAAGALLGVAAPEGVSAPKLLCGEAVERPIAEALAAGRPVTALVPRPSSGGGERTLRVRAIPLRDPGATEAPEAAEPDDAAATRPVGWALLFEADALQQGAPDEPVQFHGLWTRDPAMKQLFRIVEKVAQSDASVLVRGDTGSGKELIANAIHAISPRRKGPFRAINCAALPPNLLESELFGHVRGAFTGAVRDNPGHFRMADRGTLFLDEVAEMPLELQAKLLRVLETRSVIPVGGQASVPVDVRIVAATHRGLRAEVDAGRFRADLMYRLRVVPVFIPPLRSRHGDVMLLGHRFIEELNRRGGRRIERVSPGARAVMERCTWPGNVRELRNVIEYAFVIGDGPVLLESDLPPELSDPRSGAAGADAPAVLANRPPPVPERMRGSPEAARIWRALERAGGNRERAAKTLGMNRVTLWRRMKQLGIATAAERGDA